MKRFSSSGSLGALVPNFQPKEEETHGKESYGYSKEFQAMLDSLEQEDCGEEMPGKKRRLSSEQVKALEINFEIENKLEPERKTKLAEELGLQPRQVAIWFQNRRARWKTKQLERDYTILKADYDGLKLNFDGLEKQNKALAEKVRELKAKIMCRESAESNGSSCVKEDESPISMCKSTSRHQDFSENAECSRSLAAYQTSHSSALRMEDQQSLFSTDNQDSCNFFSVDQAPTLHWYS